MDVIHKRVPLDDSLKPLMAAFFTNTQLNPTAVSGDVYLSYKQLFVALVFACSELTLAAAMRFCFFALRTSYEEDIFLSDVVFILEHCLLPKTLDAPHRPR